jgi:chromate transporter
MSMATREKTSVWELGFLFLKLGTIGFGGPAAHIALMQDEVVRRRGWLTQEAFLDLLGATNLIPGPNSTEMAIHIGWARCRWKGLAVAGAMFILPATLLTLALAWAYLRFQTLPQLAWLLYGIKPAVLAVVVQALWRLAPAAAPNTSRRLLFVAAVAASALGANELLILLGAGLLMVVTRRMRADSRGGWMPLLPLVPSAMGAASASFGLPQLFWIFLKIGSVLFGSGYVLLAFLRAELVERLHWMTEAQLIDAIAVGQVTPGPVFTTATFIGYLLGGTRGALVSTLGIFLPAFVFVALSGPLVPRLRASPTAGAVLDGVNTASLALMAVVTAQLARAAVVDLPTLFVGLVSVLLLIGLKLNATWIVAGGALAGLGARLIQ